MTSERSRIPCLSAAAAEGTGKKQQEGRAMATLDRKVPSPEAFLGKPWSSWIDAAKLHCSDNVDLEEAGKEGGKSREVMRLNKEAWNLHGQGSASFIRFCFPNARSRGRARIGPRSLRLLSAMKDHFQLHRGPSSGITSPFFSLPHLLPSSSTTSVSL
uniref:Ataxin 7 like 1 n=1 Tax=Equus caballus TaxID=9796 RepID=A0A9L0S6Y4_HORSE